MRITGGQAKGRRLAAMKGSVIRPSSDIVRQAVFNIIGQDVTGLRVLDLFAGTGSLGIEALSRGALCVAFVDRSIRSVNQIKKNLSLCGYDAAGSLFKADLENGLPWKKPPMRKTFDLVFMDPPYGGTLIQPLLKELSEGEYLGPSSLVVVESSKTDTLPDKSERLAVVKRKIYGETKIEIYQYEVDR